MHSFTAQAAQLARLTKSPAGWAGRPGWSAVSSKCWMD